MTYIDAHMHYGGEHPEVIKWLTQADWKLLNIGGGERGELYCRLAKQHPDRYSWCTSFELEGFEEPGYAEKIIEGLQRDFANGAVAFKVFKRVGMALQDAEGKYVQMDNPIFEPIFSWLEAEEHTLLVHVAEPMGCWQPPEPSNHYADYYSKHPDYYMYGRTDRPGHDEILEARDRVIERHPKLRVVGAHFGSLEYDVAVLAKRLDKYPNFAVDTSGPARIIDLGKQDRDKVRAFIIEYADRIMFGSDRSIRKSQLEMSDEELAQSLSALKTALQWGRDYYCTDKTVTIRGFDCPGLALPNDVQEKIFGTSAKAWYPGI